MFTVRHLAFNQFIDSQEDIYFVIENAFNDFLVALLRSSNFYENELYQRSSERINHVLILFICSMIIACLSIPILFPAVNSVNKTKD